MTIHPAGTFNTVDNTWLVYPDVLTPAECDRIIETNRPHSTEVVPPHGGGLVQAHGIDDLAHLCGAEDKLYALFHRLVWATDWQIPLDIARFGVSCYLPGNSMGAHVDDEERDIPPWDLPHRGLSFSVQLSSPGDYTGGELRIQDRGEWVTASARRGDLIAFGSSTMHEVTEVTAGERWALLGWGYCNHHERDIR